MAPESSANFRSGRLARNFHLPEGTALVTMHASHIDL